MYYSQIRLQWSRYFISKKRKPQDVYSEKYGNCWEQFWYTSFIPPGARWTHSNEWCPHGPLSTTATCQQADKNTGVDCHSLLQGIFPTQGSNPGLLNHKQILSEISHIIQFTYHTIHPNCTIHLSLVYSQICATTIIDNFRSLSSFQEETPNPWALCHPITPTP